MAWLPFGMIYLVAPIAGVVCAAIIIRELNPEITTVKWLVQNCGFSG